jgi:hypothetical protein
MLDAARAGSVGSICISIKVLEGKFYFESLETRNLTPVFKKMRPDTLEKVVEKVKSDGSTLVCLGYKIKKDDLNKFFWSKREWTETEEIIYEPYLCEKESEEGFSPRIDKERSSEHGFGFVPLVWIKNLPSSNQIDGSSTYESIIDISVEIDYQLSQLGRSIKYNGDPTLVIKNPVNLEDSQIMKGVSVLNVDGDNGDAFYAETSGKFADPGMAFVRQLREYALEVARGNRTNPDKMNSVQSGKALQMLNATLISLVSEMRITYGEDGLLEVYKMVLDICKTDTHIDYGDTKPDDGEECKDKLTLDWPEWYPQSAQEKLQEAQTLIAYKDGNILTTKTALESIADEYNVLDIEDELKTIESEKDNEYNRELKSNNSNAPRGAKSKKLSGA